MYNAIRVSALLGSLKRGGAQKISRIGTLRLQAVDRGSTYIRRNAGRKLSEMKIGLREEENITRGDSELERY